MTVIVAVFGGPKASLGQVWLKWDQVRPDDIVTFYLSSKRKMESEHYYRLLLVCKIRFFGNNKW